MIIPGTVDGFDYITAANQARKWDNTSGTASIVTGVFFGSAIQGANAHVLTLPSALGTGFMAFWWYSGTVFENQIICAVQDATVAQIEIRWTTAGNVTITRNGTVLATSATTLALNTWYHLNPKFVIDNSAGAVDLHVNLASFVAVSGADTQNTANATFNQVVISTGSGRSGRHDHFMVYDATTGAGNNPTGFLAGYHAVDASLVTGAGANADWTPSASTNASNVDEANADDDTTYNSSATAGQIDTFAVASLRSGAGTILAIAVNTIDRIDDATARTVKHRILSSATAVDGAVFSPQGTYKNHQTVFDLDPNTSAAPTLAGRNAMNFGYNEIS